MLVRVQLRLQGAVGGLQGLRVDVEGAREAQERKRVGRECCTAAAAAGGGSTRRGRGSFWFAAAKDQFQRLHGPAGPADERGPGGAGVLAAGPARRCVRCWSCRRRRRRRRGLRLRRGSKRSTLPRDLQSFCWLPRFCRGRGERAAGDTTGGDGSDGCPGAAAAAGRSRRREARQHVEQSTTHGNQLFVFSFLFASRPHFFFPFRCRRPLAFFFFTRSSSPWQAATPSSPSSRRRTASRPCSSASRPAGSRRFSTGAWRELKKTERRERLVLAAAAGERVFHFRKRLYCLNPATSLSSLPIVGMTLMLSWP